MARVNVVPLTVNMTKEDRQQIDAFAKAKGYKVTAQYVRSILEKDMREHGEEIDLSVRVGGKRERKEE